MKTIVLGYIESKESERALDLAIELAGLYGARLVVTSVVPVLVGPRDPSGGPEFAHVEARAQAQGVEVETIEAFGVPSDAIVEVADRSQADLIVVGTREPSLVERLLGHSVSEGVQRRAHCNVLIVH